MDQELADAAADVPDRRCVCTHQMAAILGEMTVLPLS